MSKITILLADDHALVRQGTRELLEREGDLEVIAEASNGEEAVRLACELSPDIALMDIAMPKLNGIEATRQIKASQPKVSVLVLTAYDDDQYIFALLEAGAAGYLLKNVSADELIVAIRAVAAGEAVLHPAIARRVINRFATTDPKAAQASAFDHLSGVHNRLAIIMYLPGKRFGPGFGAFYGLDELANDFLEGVHIVVEQNDLGRLLDVDFFVLDRLFKRIRWHKK